MTKKLELFRKTPDALHEITNHEYYLTVVNGTEAISLLSAYCVKLGFSVYAPALSCWAITQGILIGGATHIRYLDINRGCSTESCDQSNCIYFEVQPWFSRNSTSKSLSINDLSANFLPESISSRCFCTIISCGVGKPAYWHKRGSILTVKNYEIAQSLEFILSLGIDELCYTRWMPRVSIVETTDKEVDEHIQWLSSIRSYREDCASELNQWILKCPHLSSILQSYTGNSMLLPVIYNGPLTIRTIINDARRMNLPIGWQPVSPAYLQAGFAGSKFVFEGNCPRAESLCKHLLFVPIVACNDIQSLKKLIHYFNHECN